MQAPFWQLPGSRRFAENVRVTVARGYSPLVVLPRVLLHHDVWRDGLMHAVDCNIDEVRLCDDGGRPPESVIAERFGIDDIRPGPNAASQLAQHAVTQGRVMMVVIDGAVCGTWMAFAERFVAATKPLPLADRPILLMLASAEAASTLTRSATLLAPLWWWGALDRLDTAVYVAERLTTARSDVVLRDSIVEVAAYDLALADHLAEHWNGAADSLEATLLSYDSGAADEALPSAPQSSTPMEPPPANVTSLWDRGLIDSWDVFPAYIHSSALARTGRAGELRARVWRAQLRSLMPVVDEERSRLAEWLRSELPRDQSLPDPAEPNDLCRALQANPSLRSWRGGHRRRLAYWLRDTRNTLAHMGTLGPGEIQLGNKLIAADRTCS